MSDISHYSCSPDGAVPRGFRSLFPQLIVPIIWLPMILAFIGSTIADTSSNIGALIDDFAEAYLFGLWWLKSLILSIASVLIGRGNHTPRWAFLMNLLFIPLAMIPVAALIFIAVVVGAQR